MGLRAWSRVFAALTVLSAPLCWANTHAQETQPDFSLSVADAASIDGDNPLQISDQGFAGNPMERFGWWPEDLVLAPIPSRSPELGWGLALVGGYFLDLDKQSADTPPSVVGAALMATENDSYGIGLGGYLHLLDDRVRVRGGAAFFDLNYRFYGIGSGAGDRGRSVDIVQEMPFVYASASYEIAPNTYLGLGYFGGRVETALERELPVFPDFPDPTLDLDISALEIPFEYDTRDHAQFPRAGWLVSARGMLYREGLGTDFDAETLKVSVNHYRPMRERDVLALRGYARTTGGDAPFFLLSTFGGRSDLRGYDVGRYRDKMMYAVQAEYRWQPREKWIFTGFAGVGEVAPDLGGLFDDFLPAAGVGIRFVLSEKHKISLALDVATGKQSTLVYFGIGEAF